MKKIIYLLLFIAINSTAFSQAKLPDGIYLIDELKSKTAISQLNKVLVKFDPLFVKEDPDEYEPISIFIDDFVPFELTGAPVIQNQKDQENFLLVNLTASATEKLGAFTARNLMSNIAVVVNGQALSIYKVVQPVISKEIEIARCNGVGCKEVYKRLKGRLKYNAGLK